MRSHLNRPIAAIAHHDSRRRPACVDLDRLGQKDVSARNHRVILSFVVRGSSFVVRGLKNVERKA
jgi:hypothetical protein